MKRVWLGGCGVVVGGLLVQGCFALDWEFSGAAGAGGENGVSGSSSSGTSSNEDCTNDVDDDSDGKIDCGDPDCHVLYECAAAMPEGWDPYWVIETAYGESNSVKCPDGQEAAVLFAEPATTTTCSACTCSYIGAACSAPRFDCNYYNPTCAGASVDHQSNTTNCLTLPSDPQNITQGSCKINAHPLVLDWGTCSAEPSNVVNSQVFGKQIQLCSRPSGEGAGCALGDVCTLKKSGGLSAARTCIVQAGTLTCPMGWTKSTTAAFEGGTDERSCSHCGCDLSTVTCSGGKVTIHQGQECSASKAVLTTLGECVTTSPFGFYGGSASFVLGTPNPGTCTQATPSGSVQTTGPHTICCRDQGE